MKTEEGKSTTLQVGDKIMFQINQGGADLMVYLRGEKKLVWRDESNKSHIYEPAITKENTQTLLLSKMIQNVFSGSSSDLIMHALGNNHTNSEELNKIEALIKQLKSK